MVLPCDLVFGTLNFDSLKENIGMHEVHVKESAGRVYTRYPGSGIVSTQ